MQTSSKKMMTAAFMACMTLQAQAQLVINELMQSNIDCIMDDLNEFPDSWVELYNSGTAPVNLQDYQLGISDNANAAWQLPDKTVEAHQYILVFCDKEALGLHTDFRLESGKGGEVWLFNNGQVADKVTGMKKQPAPNIAYGRETDGADKWGYQQTPTPEAENCGKLCSDVLGEPVFSEKGRVWTTSQMVNLTLSLPDGSPEGAEIRYTLDGTEPTATSTLYQSPISFNTNKRIRAKVFCDGWLSPRSTTHSFIFFPTSRELTLPVVSIVTDTRYLYDSKIGIYVDGSYQSGKKNYEFDWRRPINLELFEEAGQESVINQLCETRIMGGATRSNKFKSLAVYANKRFGKKRLEYEFFPDQRPGIKDFKSIALRNAGNDFDYLYMRDAIIQRNMAGHVDLDWQSWRPVIIYINGTYSGILNIRDRSNEDNIYTYYDGLEDIDMFENWGELKEGDWDNYNAFKAFYYEYGHTMAEYEQWMDCQEFINLMAMNLYYNNQDFPGNNIVMWRPKADGGRWRWIAKDTDFGLGLYGSDPNYKTLEWLHNPDYDWNRNWGANSYEATRLFRRLMEDADFKREFLDHTAIYMGDFLNERGTRAVWDPMYDIIKTEYPFHRTLINQWWPNYNDELNNARNWVRRRTDYFYQQLADYYHLGTPTPLTVNKELTEDVQTVINGISIKDGYFDGKFFAGRNLTVEGIAPEGREVKGWSIIETKDDGTSVTTEVESPSYTFAMPSCKSLSLTAVTGDASGINPLHSPSWSWRTDGSLLTVNGIEAGQRVSVYNMQGHLLHQSASTGSEIQWMLPGVGVYVIKTENKHAKITIR